MLSLREYLEADGSSPFGDWFARLDATSAAKLAVVLGRMAQGNLSNVKGVGEGVLEYRLHHGPGYRVYFGRDGDALVILLGAGRRRGSSVTSRLRGCAGQRTNGASEWGVDTWL